MLVETKHIKGEGIRVRCRISVDLSTAEAVTVIRGTMDRLNALWDEVYMDEAQRIESESEMVISVKASINDWLPEINEMRAELGLPAFETHPYRPESVGLVSFD
uniref:Uncharacterized protein n=1 Tax=Parascaris equorum TaxID=6256 RepID=A0A914RHT7_PAREQ